MIKFSLRQLFYITLFFALSIWTWKNYAAKEKSQQQHQEIAARISAVETQLGISNTQCRQAVSDQITAAAELKQLGEQMLARHDEVARKRNVVPKPGSLISYINFPCAVADGYANGKRVHIPTGQKFWLRGGWRSRAKDSPSPSGRLDGLEGFETADAIENSDVYQVELPAGTHELRVEFVRIDSQTCETRAFLNGQKIVGCVSKDLLPGSEFRDTVRRRQFNCMRKGQLKKLDNLGLIASLSTSNRETFYYYQLWISDVPLALPGFPSS